MSGGVRWREDVVEEEEDLELGGARQSTQSYTDGYDTGFPELGAVMNDESEGDGDYVDRMVKRSRQKPLGYDPRLFYYGKRRPKTPDIDAIEETLEELDRDSEEIGFEPGTTEYYRKRLERRQDCPLCSEYDSYGYHQMKEHLREHREVVRYQDFLENALRDFSEMREHRKELIERITILQNSIVTDLPFPKNVGKKLIAKGKASPHHFIPQSGWISCYVNGQDVVPNVIELFRMQYERMTGYGEKPTRVSLAQSP